MRLLKLSANKSSFRTVEFNRSGLSFIVGAKKSQEESTRNRTRTYNGVGKSLLIELVHFCLGSDANDAFKKHLVGWRFDLTIEVEHRQHLITRLADKPREVTLDEKKMSLS